MMQTVGPIVWPALPDWRVSRGYRMRAGIRLAELEIVNNEGLTLLATVERMEQSSLFQR
jgi:hypothetical protein